MPRPSKPELLELLGTVEIALSSMMRRRTGAISPEIRVEIMIEAYEPVLRMLIRAGRLPLGKIVSHRRLRRL